MIRSIRHKGLRLLYEENNGSKLSPDQVSKIRIILSRQEAAFVVEDMNYAGSGFHGLTGNLQGFWSVKVSRNYRIIFRFESENAYDVDYLDYH